MGCITVQSDPDGPVRTVMPLFRFRDEYYPSFPLAVAALSLGQKPALSVTPGPALDFAGRKVPLDEQGRLLVRWYGPTYTYRHYSVWKVFNSALAYESGRKPDIPPEAFRDKIVLIGATAAGASDVRSNAFSPSYPGVEIHATVIDNLLQADFLRAAPEPWTAAAILLLALLMAGLVYLFRSALLYTLLAMLAGLAYFAGVCALFRSQNLWAPMVGPLAAGTLAFTGSTLTRYATEGREKRKYRKTLLKYLSPQLVETIMQDFNWASLRAEKRNLTVLFSDIRGFTSISEKLPPEAVVATLNEHLNMMVSVIFKHQGTLDKFVGDCVMAFWGAPLAQPNHAELAARAALEMIEGLEKLNRKWQSEGRPTLQIGVGINTGEMLFGNIGSEQRMDFTVIGDNVNLGSRLESATKELHATIVISDATYQQIRDKAQVRPLGEISVKGQGAEDSGLRTTRHDRYRSGERGRVMKRMLRLFSLLVLGALLLALTSSSGQPAGPSLNRTRIRPRRSSKKKKKKGGFFGGLKAITGESSEQQEVTATAGSKTVGEGEQIGEAKPTAADRQAVTAMENYSVPEKDLKKFQDDGQLKPKQ